MSHINEQMKNTVFVTVGSTKFDELIQAVDDVRMSETLVSLGYEQLIIQKGRGDYVLKNLLQPGEAESVMESGLIVRCFDYVPSVAEFIAQSSLIICHAGAGSVFEGLQAQKSMIVVPNALLMDNHQVELASQLETMGHLISATPQNLLEKLSSISSFTSVPYIAQGPARMAQRLDQLFPRSKGNP